MTPRQKNMLEAFQASSQESAATSGAEAQEPTSAPEAPRRAKSGLPDVAPEFFAVVLGVLVVGAFFLGRWTMDVTVQAADGERGSEATAEEVSLVQPPTYAVEATPAMTEDIESVADPTPRLDVSLDELSLMEQHTQAFMDPANTITLRVIYYADDEDGRRRALETTHHLQAMGFPAVNPIRKGDYVYVCVGAAPSKSDPDLLRYQRELQLVPGPKPYGKPGDYQSAFTYNIDRLISR